MAEILREIGSGLNGLVDQSVKTDLSDVLDGIGRVPNRIAVVGQVKAGKSSLINALIGRPGFVPTDVNPWTSVVTKLHFGQQSSDGTAAVFEFFNDEDWKHLAEGGRLQELTLRLGIPVDQESLIAQVGAMRAKAEARLGSKFYHLLGKQHRFASASSDILARYICAGDLDDVTNTVQQPVAGRFADITKSAELYLDHGPFAYPTTVIDTPGTNDPFLVRGEITRGQMDVADVYLVVLTAQQAMSTADLGLLRMLHGLHKQRLIVFINRIDLLPDIATNAARLASHTRNKLAEEFPGSDIPVIVGSARWAELAVDAGALAGSSEKTSPSFTDYARSKGALGPSGFRSASEISSAMKACSGLSDLNATIAALMNKGPAMRSLQQTSESMATILANLTNAAESEVSALETMALETRRTAPSTADGRVSALRQLDQFKRMLPELAQTESELSLHLQEVRDVAVDSLRISLNTLIARFAKEQGQVLKQELQRNRQMRVWRCDTHGLRTDLEHVFIENCRQSMTELTEAEDAARSRLEGSVREVLEAYRLNIADHKMEMIDPAPSISALGTVLSLDLGEEWGQWWRRWRNDDQRVRQLETLILDEFTPIAAALIDVAEADLEAHITVITHRMAKTCRELPALLDRKKAILDQDDDAGSGNDQQKDVSGDRPDEEKLEKARSLLRACRDASSRLGQLHHLNTRTVSKPAA